jgi:hypothetical protein
MAADSIIILSHACYAAGGPTCGDQKTISLEESERRVKQYASPSSISGYRLIMPTIIRIFRSDHQLHVR